MKHLTIFSLLALTIAISAPRNAEARSYLNTAKAYISLAAFEKGWGDVDHNIDFLVGRAQYGRKCIENFSEISGPLGDLRENLDSGLGQRIIKFYKNESSDSEIQALGRDLEQFNHSVAKIEALKPRFLETEECNTHTEAHRKNVEALFWHPIPERLRLIHTLVSSDWKSLGSRVAKPADQGDAEEEKGETSGAI